ncbi:MAG: uridine kinase, partial [Clostridia bacterium]|nr:uridine kinase [Clostridia bacterium]
MNPVQLFARHPGPFFAVLDGPCASGKTTLAAFLEHAIPNLYIVHMDDYYIPMAQKTPERLSVPGGNADKERLLEEVLLPHRAGKDAVVRPYF